MHKRILFVDDKCADPRWKLDFKREWKDLNFEVICEAQSDQTLKRLEHDGPFHLLLLDLWFENQELQGEDLLPMIKKESPELPVIVLSGRDDNLSKVVSTATECMRIGASSFFAKQDLDFQKLALEIQNHIQLAEERQKTRELTEQLEAYQKYDDLIYQSKPMEDLVEQLNAFADSTAPVLITGETGTGKELVARALHRYSSRSDKDMVVVNCAAIPPELLESELFGHERGAFSGATHQKIGKFERANGGTLFLDEIGEMPTEMQPKLLRALQEGEIERVGGKGVIHVDVRTIAATNKDLSEQVRLGHFRRDLYHRLNVLPVHVPPLQDRKADIPILVEHFRKKFNEEHGYEIQAMTPECLKPLSEYDWPGNVRELENVMERAFTLARAANEDMILPKHLAPLTNGIDVSPHNNTNFLCRRYVNALYNNALSWQDIDEEFDAMKQEIVIAVLEEERGNGRSAAKRLGITRGNLAQWLRKWEISTLDFRS